MALTGRGLSSNLSHRLPNGRLSLNRARESLYRKLIYARLNPLSHRLAAILGRFLPLNESIL